MNSVMEFVTSRHLAEGLDLAHTTLRTDLEYGFVEPPVGTLVDTWFALMGDLVRDELTALSEGSLDVLSVPGELLDQAIQDGSGVAPGEVPGPSHQEGLLVARAHLVAAYTMLEETHFRGQINNP